jgi:hypothetical protein
MLSICQFICSFCLFSAKRSEHETTHLAVNLHMSSAVDHARGGFSSNQWLSCSLFAPIAHFSPQNLLTLHAYYHLAGRVREKDAHLTVFFAASCAAVLAFHACRLLSLLQKPRFVNDEDRLWIRQMLLHISDEIIAHCISVEVGPLRASVASRLG